jgi:hypothetical protein
MLRDQPLHKEQSISYMQSWWNSSPYWDVGVYLHCSPGCDRNDDSRLDLTWMNAVQSQGWGVIPIWLGLQAQHGCTIKKDFIYTIDPATAFAQGVQQADKAIVQAQSLGLAGTILYNDLENYSPGPTCSPPVIAYLSGWVTELHAQGFKAAAYGNRDPAGIDFSQVSPSLDDVWVAKADHRVTIWGLGFTDSDVWTSDQRIHQYNTDTFEQWGSSPSFKTDSDIVDAQIVANDGVKGYGFARGSIEPPGSTSSAAYAIANPSPGQTGKLVGYYDTVPGNVHGFSRDGTGSFTDIDYLGTNFTLALGISNLGSIVGMYSDSLAHGFLKNGIVPIAINYPGAQDTRVWGINDAGHMVGDYHDIGGWHGFLKYAGNFYSIDIPLPDVIETHVWGINGHGQMVGTYEHIPDGWHGFLARKDFSTGVLTIDYIDYPGWQQTFTYGINNNSQLVGNSDVVQGQTTEFVFTSNGFLPLQYPDLCELHGLNDATQIVGSCWTQTVPEHGVLLLPF